MATLQTEQVNRFAVGLKAAGLKLTTQRRAICQVLAELEGHEHPTAQTVYEAAKVVAPGVSLATVYNTLTVLKDAGLVYELSSAGDGSTHYELNTDTHVNVVCIKCKRILDLHLPVPEDLGSTVADRSGFQLLSGQFLYYGQCPDCQ